MLGKWWTIKIWGFPLNVQVPNPCELLMPWSWGSPELPFSWQDPHSLTPMKALASQKKSRPRLFQNWPSGHFSKGLPNHVGVALFPHYVVCATVLPITSHAYVRHCPTTFGLLPNQNRLPSNRNPKWSTLLFSVGLPASSESSSSCRAHWGGFFGGDW